MRVLVAKSAGFCFGVKRAADMAFEAARCHDATCSLGPLIHSPQLVKKLEEEGVRVLRTLEEYSEGAVIIRSHGVPLEDIEQIGERNLVIVDATCPFVKKAQEHAATLSREGYLVVLVGEEDHPEVQGIVSYARGGEVVVVADPSQALELPRYNKVGVVAQTTQSFENLRRVVEICLEKSQELRVFNTICDATSVRQNEARSISGQADLVLVIGGFNSANTTRLASICMEIQPNTHHVETAGEIDPAWFEGVESVGITAGASTPRWIIEEVVKKVESFGK